MTDLLEYRNRLERVEELLDELEQRAILGEIIIVEGKRDVLSLNKLGIKGNIKTASHQPLLNFAELIERSGENVVILTDWDRRGDILASKIAGYLEHSGIEVDTDIRMRLQSLVKKEIKDIESVYTYVTKLRQLAGNEKWEYWL
ncbi:TOPRIM domain protein [Methanosalsum zhilinae DSM 4017]|uniref:UPF0292 protein Mzhil_1807 n=1 Tax=Methanosalsum zhilinae (strain DSM 4017 / NBRC 107636 / OCM 62 / WeN5) TaxID=679901 RepID=F7XQP3_METZD|nr:toprim domain-containing protein [Methanosalsum zhilinae]AEH61642.1 TOPRIM domain protein [Methanosalsum zhilinae DSM 4017]